MVLVVRWYFLQGQWHFYRLISGSCGTVVFSSGAVAFSSADKWFLWYGGIFFRGVAFLSVISGSAGRWYFLQGQWHFYR